jgi:hypothetical protein
MAFSKQITSVKFDFYNTSTVASVASTTLSVNGIDFTKKMESLTAPFVIKTMSGKIKNNWNGFRVMVSLMFDSTIQASSLDTLITQFYTYKDSTVVECRFYPDFDVDTTNYLVVKLDSEVELIQSYQNQITTTQSGVFQLIENQIRTSIPSFLTGV